MITIPGISDLFEPLEECIKSCFLPALLGGYSFSETDRKIFGLLVRFGGFATFNPTEACQLEFDFSLIATTPLKSAILQQRLSLTAQESLEMSSKKSKRIYLLKVGTNFLLKVCLKHVRAQNQTPLTTPYQLSCAKCGYSIHGHEA